MVCHDWLNRSRDIRFFRSKYGQIRHFLYDVIFFYVDIFETGFLYHKALIEYFQKMYHRINAFEIIQNVLTQQKIAFLWIFRMHLSSKRYVR